MATKRPSGGKRAVMKKHAMREAERKRASGGDPKADWTATLELLGEPPLGDPEKAHIWLAKAALIVVRATLADTAIPPEQMRRDVMKQIEQASKVLDPAKLSAQLDELETALEELRKQHAGDVATGEDRPPSPSASLS